MRLIIIIHLFITLLFSSSIEFSLEEQTYINKQRTPVKIGVLNSYKPFSFLKNGKEIGFTQDLLEIISKKSGLKFEKTAGSWSEIYPLFKKGELDMISEISYREDRKEFTEFTEPYYEVPLGIFTNGICQYNGLSSLENKKVAVIKDSFLKTLLKEIKGIEIVEVNSTDEKFQVLLNKHVDIVISSAMSILYIESLMYKDIKLSGYFEHPEVKKEDLRFGIQKSQSILASIIQKSLQAIDFATLTELKRKWIVGGNIVSPIKINLTKKEKEFIKKHKTIRVSNELDWAPFDFTVDGEPQGYSIDLLNLLASKIGVEIKYINGYSWSKLLQMFEDKKLDMLHSINKTPSRETMGLFSDAYIRYKTHFITRKDMPRIDSFNDLKGKTIVVGEDWAIDEFITNNYPQIKLLKIKGGMNEILQLISNAQADATIGSDIIVRYFLKKKYFTGLKVNSWAKEFDSHSGRMLYFMAQKNMPELISLLNKAMDSLSIQEIDQLYKKWFPEQNPDVDTYKLTYMEKEFMKEHPVIRFRVRPNRAPFEFEKNGEAVGIAVDYVKISAQNMGLKVKFIIDNSPIKEAYYTVAKTRDKFDTLLFTVRNPQRDKKYSFGIDYLSYPMMIITHKEASFIGSLQNLKEETIVLEKGFLTNEWIKRDYPEINIINAHDTKAALEMVNKGKVLAYVGNLGIANYMSVFGGMENLKIAAPTDYKNINYSFIAPKEWPELTSILTKGYKQITPVEHSALQQKWFSVQTIDKTNYKTIGTILLVLIFIILWILWWNRKLSNERKKTELVLNDLQKTKEELELKNKEVYESQQFLQSMLDESPNPIIIKNYDGKFVLVNKAVAQLYNTTKENMIGKDDGDFIKDKKMVEFFNHNVKDVIDHGETQVIYEDSQDLNTGETRHFMSIKKPFTNIQGEKVILVIANDITEMKKLEEEKLKNQEILFSQSKVAAMGEMIGNIAHQWRQPLSVISTASTGLMMEKEIGVLTDEKLKNTLESINDYAQYLSTTIDTFRDYVKTEKVYKEVILQDGIKTALDIVDASFKNNYITIKSNYEKLEPIKIKLVIGELSEVLINILNNSKDALKERKIKNNPWVEIKVNSYKDKVVITIEDNAGGIPDKVISKIFEPYFTTKHQSQGTGLGLHMSYKIITESLRGKIYAKNTKNGAMFTIELPQVDRKI